MRLYEIKSNTSLVGQHGRGYFITSNVIPKEHLNYFWKKFWDGREPVGEIDGEGFGPRYLTKRVMERFYSIYNYSIDDGFGRFVIELSEGEINENEFLILKRFIPEIKDMRHNY